jgi:hypothetical protein
LVNRKRVYLTGSVPWAVTTLIYSYVRLQAEK